ncbi:AMP-binding protein [Comamonas flocculans]|uniref:AMP-binding protein n=1 Tax=Comamonas flocculans TaxID=2597701 RepID=A0A5B8RXE6_9BURK|nr:AMP-binding protein [Comamonas flocculans]QEA12487.1 AMP-binding protein [Comamonas flocculans]
MKNPFDTLETVGVIASNSTDYVRRLLSNLAQGLVSVPLTGSGDEERLAFTHTNIIQRTDTEGGWIAEKFTSRSGDDAAQISFTSGTQGKPKAVLLSHGNLHDAVCRVTETMEIDNEIREYVGVPVYHSFGYGRCRVVLNASGACYVPSGGFDLAEIRHMLIAGEINAISAVPSLWRVFLAGLDRFGGELKRVRWVEIGSQYMSATEKAALRSALPNARIVQHYGLTEASRTTLQRIHEEPAETLGSVGQVSGAVRVRIGDDGRIEISGPHVALGVAEGEYWRALGHEVWLQTSDLGRIDDGRLYYLGRADDVINCGGIKLSPDLMEAAVRTELLARNLDVGEFAILRRPDPMRGDGIGVVVTSPVKLVQDTLVDAVAMQAGAQGANARGAISVHEVQSLPRTATGKIQRVELAHVLEARLTLEESGRDETNDTFSQFLERLVGHPISLDMLFADLDGDSLIHLQVGIALERALGDIPAGWESWPLRRLVSVIEGAGYYHFRMAAGENAPPLPDGSRNMNPDNISFWNLVREDYRTNEKKIMSQGFLMLFVHRFGNWRMGVRKKIFRAPLTIIYRILNKTAQIVCGIKLDYTVQLGRRVKLEHFGGMILGARKIGNDVIIRQNTTFGIRSIDDLNAKPIIGDFVDIGAGAVIVGNIEIGENTIIGANSVVFVDIPPNSIVMGNPGRIIGVNRRKNLAAYSESSKVDKNAGSSRGLE